MGLVKLEQRGDSYYVLEIRTENFEMVKGLMDADKPVAEISQYTKTDGLQLEIK